MKSKFPCVCCGFLTRSEPSNGDYDICPVCYWEDDPIQSHDLNMEGGANKISLAQARVNYKKYGAMEECFMKLVRFPCETEFPDKG